MMFGSRPRHSAEPPGNGDDRSLIWWSVAGILLSFLALVHLLVMLCFVLDWRVPSVLAPVAFVLAALAIDALGRREAVHPRRRLYAPGIGLGVVAAAVLLAGAFYDMSWDGLWYHQTAVYQMAHGWNPLAEPMRDFVPHLQDWVRHYAKGSWYVALAFFSATGDIETAKAAPWITLAATCSAVVAACVDAGLLRWKALLFAALVSFNPVTVFELPSYLVDGMMISFLACFVAALSGWLRRPSLLALCIMSTSAVLCINAKQTGLVYLCFAVLGGGLYVLLKRRGQLFRYVAIQSAAVLLGLFLFGFNPYVTNTVHRGHPFYPVLGTSEFPSHRDQGEDAIEKYETPHNMMGQSRFFRLGYALFGRPGAQPFFPGEDAELMVPFDVGWDDFRMFYFHDVRISGFGPLFSGVFLISALSFGLLLVRGEFPREILWICAGTIVLSLLISEHTWWARYGPQLWWFPMLTVLAGFAGGGGRGIRWLTWVVAGLLVINVALIAGVHYRWEIDATRTTTDQLRRLRGAELVEVDFQYFGEPYGERLKAGGVKFVPVQTLQCERPIELMSVSPGYPMAVRACVK